jgi:four helix bundle protein
MAGLRDPREFDVWKLSEALRQRLEGILERSGFVAHARLRGQLDEASARICPNLAEGFSRYLSGDHARFVRIAAASLSEIIEHLHRARRKNLITEQEMLDLQVLARRARGAAIGLIRYLQTAEPPHLPPKRRRTPSKARTPAKTDNPTNARKDDAGQGNL